MQRLGKTIESESAQLGTLNVSANANRGSLRSNSPKASNVLKHQGANFTTDPFWGSQDSISVSKSPREDNFENKHSGEESDRQYDFPESHHLSSTPTRIMSPGDESSDCYTEQALTSEDIPFLKPSIKMEHEDDDFYSRKEDIYAIEVLQPTSGQFQKRTRRFIASRITHRASDTIDFAPMPSRIRIRSALLLELLERATNTKLHSHTDRESTTPKDLASMVFLYPFKLFIRYEQSIRRYMDAILDGDPEPQEPPGSLDGDNKLLPSKFMSKEAHGLVQVLRELFQVHLSSVLTIRHELRNKSRNTILFDHLWLLYDAGDIVYVKSQPERKHEPPRLWMIMAYGGGRAILNDDEPSSLVDPQIVKEDLGVEGCRGRETEFWIRGFWLESTGNMIHKEEDVYTIPAWEGDRPVRKLKIFPWDFCKPGHDFTDIDLKTWKNRLMREGRSYSLYRQGTVRFLEGAGTDMDDNTWELRSKVIIDLEQAALEAPELSKRLPGEESLYSQRGRIQSQVNIGNAAIVSMTLFHGDDREVRETPPQLSFKGEKGGIRDQIHDDISLDHHYFQNKLRDLLPPLSSFRSPEEAKLIPRKNFALFPQTLTGFALSARKWIRFEHRFLTEAYHNNVLWSELKLPKGHKRAILAAVRGRRRPGHGAPNFDVVPEKGAGCIILLQGTSGVGKTFTAEALASKLKKPLYSITGSDLGDDIHVVDRRLSTVLNHGRRWGCVMLLDEADIYLRTRAPDSLQFNSIVGIFLRQLDWFPGIMILTTNIAGIDPAIVDRCQLRLELPPLNRKAIEDLWETYCSEERLHKFTSQSAAKDLNVQVDPEIIGWWGNHYDDAAKEAKTNGDGSFVSGRDVQHLLRSAAGLAIYDAMKEKRKSARRSRKDARKGKEAIEAERETKKASRLKDGDKVFIRKKHLEDAYSLWINFKRNRDGEYVLHAAVDEELQYDDQDNSSYDEISSDEDAAGYFSSENSGDSD